jgi:hypothetical protein
MWGCTESDWRTPTYVSSADVRTPYYTVSPIAGWDRKFGSGPAYGYFWYSGPETYLYKQGTTLCPCFKLWHRQRHQATLWFWREWLLCGESKQDVTIVDYTGWISRTQWKLYQDIICVTGWELFGDVWGRPGIQEHSMNVKIRQEPSSPLRSYPGLHNRYSRSSQIPIFWIECWPWPRNTSDVYGIYQVDQHCLRRQEDMFGPYHSVRTHGTWKHEW